LVAGSQQKGETKGGEPPATFLQPSEGRRKDEIAGPERAGSAEGKEEKGDYYTPPLTSFLFTILVLRDGGCSAISRGGRGKRNLSYVARSALLLLLAGRERKGKEKSREKGGFTGSSTVRKVQKGKRKKKGCHSTASREFFSIFLYLLKRGEKRSEGGA